ncbi:serine hydrolase [Paenibacillus mendelii]|uniref:Serine hydrolase n=1 Tax=Paenibacillus mendelii TaxID=206163 RepID=A0ABV6JBR9_9BACL|nr:serine hydrolase [Paenibacillus mendelii]MCQ6562617.1 serine hydrolase [Paenibacillus mendelii]
MMTNTKQPILKITLLTSILAASLLPSLSAPYASAIALEQDLTGIASVVQPIIDNAKQNGIRVSVGLEDVSGAYGDDSLLLGSSESYMPASTIKVALISALLQQVDKGVLTLDKLVTVEKSDVVGGTGSLQKETFPQEVSIARLARLTITQSDNTATNVLIDEVGLDNVQALMDQLGLEVMHLGRKMFASAPTPEQDNYINAADLAALLDQIYSGQFLSNTSRNQLITWMSAQEVNTKFGAALPDAPIAHKTGENANVTHDAGFFLVPGHEIAISVMTEVTTTKDFDEAQKIGNPIVQDIAKAVYHALVEDREASEASSITRAEFVSLLARQLGLTSTAAKPSFADVLPGSAYYDDIAAAREAEIINGLPGNTFGPAASITRAEMAAMFVRAYEYAHGELQASTDGLPYEDQAKTPAWAKEAILKVSQLNAVSAYEDGTFRPAAPSTRSDGIQMLASLWELAK